jgi:hypothetical protein
MKPHREPLSPPNREQIKVRPAEEGSEAPRARRVEGEEQVSHDVLDHRLSTIRLGSFKPSGRIRTPKGRSSPVRPPDRFPSRPPGPARTTR